MALIYPSYDPSVDYAKLNLEFELKYGVETLTSLILDKETIIGIHKLQQETRLKHGYHRSDYLDFCLNLKRNYTKTTLSDMLLDFNKLNANGNQPMYAFITVGWNEQTITPQKMLNVSQNILNLKYFKTAIMVLEKHRENGIHHHTHYLVEFVEKYPVSKVLGWIFQTRGVKELCLNKNFIDYLGPQNGKKPYQLYLDYLKYINGDKQDKKLQFCALDKTWRADNGILDLYIKK